jgi:hypothetical protein
MNLLINSYWVFILLSTEKPAAVESTEKIVGMADIYGTKGQGKCLGAENSTEGYSNWPEIS